MTTSRYVGLDGLRGIAAIAVVAMHSQPALWSGAPLPSAYLAVDFFFALSGFVLAHAYLPHLKSGMSIWQFVVKRLIRLYPLFFLSGVIGLAFLGLRFARGGISLSDFSGAALNLLLIPSPGAYHLYPLNFPAWSLALELVVNVLFAAVALRLNRIVLAMLVGAGATALIISTIVFQTLDVGIHWFDAWGGIGRVCFSFFLGVALYRIHSGLRLNLSPWTAAPLVAALIAPFFFEIGPTYEFLVAAILYPAILLIGAHVRSPMPKVAEFLGNMSYALYILHIPLRWFVEAAMDILEIEPAPAIGVVFIAGSVVAAGIADAFYDRRIRRWLTATLLQPKHNTGAVTATIPGEIASPNTPRTSEN